METKIIKKTNHFQLVSYYGELDGKPIGSPCLPQFCILTIGGTLIQDTIPTADLGHLFLSALEKSGGYWASL